MSDPYIIWTMRRTGGTTLASLLAQLSEHPTTAHEPFNVERVFGSVVSNWRQSKDKAQLRSDVTASLSRRPTIKHCYEILPPELSQALMEISTEKGYRHIVLDRRAEDDRILSLELAKITGAWGAAEADKVYADIEAGKSDLPPFDLKDALAHRAFCDRRRRDLAAQFETLGQTPFVLFFEDVYSDPEAGRRLVDRLVRFVGLDPADHETYEDLVSDSLRNRGQNSARIMDAVPNVDQVRRELRAAARASYRFPAS